jgi:hypothetical protein
VILDPERGWEEALLSVLLHQPDHVADLPRVLASVRPDDWSSPVLVELWRWIQRQAARDGIVCPLTLSQAAVGRRRADLLGAIQSRWGSEVPGAYPVLVERYAEEVRAAGARRILVALHGLEARALLGEEVTLPTGERIEALTEIGAVVAAVDRARAWAVAPAQSASGRRKHGTQRTGGDRGARGSGGDDGDPPR